MTGQSGAGSGAGGGAVVRVGGAADHHQTLLAHLQPAHTLERLSDLTFLCRDGPVHAHTCLLRKVSRLVDSEGAAVLAVQSRVVVTLDQVDSETVKVLLQFLYTGRVRLGERQADSLHQLCTMLQIDFGEEKVSIQGQTRPETKSSQLSPASPASKVCTSSAKPVSPASRPQSQVHSSTLARATVSSLKSNPHAPITVKQLRRVIQAKSVPEKISAVTKKLSLKERKEKEEQERQVAGSNPEQPSPGQGSNPGLIEGPVNSTLYCYCQKPSTKDLIGCDECPAWYHPACLSLSPRATRLLLSLPAWRCPECEAGRGRDRGPASSSAQLNLPIPQGCKFSEVVVGRRLDSWGLTEFLAAGWRPHTRHTWHRLPPGEGAVLAVSYQDCSQADLITDTFLPSPELEDCTETATSVPHAPHATPVTPAGVRRGRGRPPGTRKPADGEIRKAGGKRRRESGPATPLTPASPQEGRKTDLVRKSLDMEQVENELMGDQLMSVAKKAKESNHVKLTEIAGKKSADDGEKDPEHMKELSQSYDELFFCYICKSIYVSKMALDDHYLSAHC